MRLSEIMNQSYLKKDYIISIEGKDEGEWTQADSEIEYAPMTDERK